MRLKWLLTIMFCLSFAANGAAQGKQNDAMRAIKEYFSNYTPEKFRLKNCGLERKRGNIVFGKKRITIYTNSNFGSQVFTPELVESIYAGIRDALPGAYKKYKIEVIANHKRIEYLVPNIYRKK